MSIQIKPSVGIEISSCDKENPIAAWPAKKGGFFAKIFFYNGSDITTGEWRAVSGQKQIGASGIITFIEKQPSLGQKLKLKRVSDKVAFGEIIN